MADGFPGRSAADRVRVGGAVAVPRRSVLAAGLFGGVAALAGCGNNNNTGTSTGPQLPRGDDLVIGASLELTGTGALVGLAQRKAITIAQNKLNTAGVVVNNQVRQVRVTIKDNGSDPNTAATLTRQFAADPQVLAIVGGCTAATARAMAPIAEQQKIPFLATCAADTIVRPVASRRFVFKLGPNAMDVANLLVGSIRTQGFNRVAIVAETGDHGDTGVAAMTTALNNAGRNIVATVRVPVGVHAYGAQTDQVAARKPDAVVVWAVAPTSGLVARALRTSQYAGRLFFDTGAASEDALSKLNRDATIDSFLAAPTIMGGRPVAVTTPAELDQVHFFEQYTQLYGAFSGLAVYAADAVNLAAEAAQRGRTEVTRIRVRDELEAAPYDGLAGQYVFSTVNHGGVQPNSLSLFKMRRADWVKMG